MFLNRFPDLRSRSRVAAWLLVLASGVAGCATGEDVGSGGVDISERPRMEVRGVVLDAFTETAISGAMVSAKGSPAVRADASGRFTLSLPEGTHSVFAAAAGYGSAERVNVRVTRGGGTGLEIVLFPSSPTDSEMDAYLRRQPPRRHAHPAHDRPTPRPSPAPSDDGDGIVGSVAAPLVDAPNVIRVWRSSRAGALAPTFSNNFADNSCDPSAEVETIPLEDYVSGVVPREWGTTWHAEALRAGAIAARTYAVNWALRGGRWDCADVDDGTVTQAYRDERYASTNAAVAATEHQVITRNGVIISSEYSAENSDPTADGVEEPTCTGETRNGHGRGMCQWGTQRWANGICATEPCDFGVYGAAPKDHLWMIDHYYPGTLVETAVVPPLPPCATIPAEGAVLDDTGPCFRTYGDPAYWREEADGYLGHLYWTNAFQSAMPGNYATWTLHFESPGDYELEVYVDPDFGVHTTARYLVTHAGGETEVVVDQGAADGWVSLGTFSFGVEGEVRLLDNEATAVPADQRIVADALWAHPVGAPLPDAGPVSMGADLGPVGSVDAGMPRRRGARSGCAVGTDPRSATSGWALFGVALGLGWVVGRRRRARQAAACTRAFHASRSSRSSRSQG